MKSFLRIFLRVAIFSFLRFSVLVSKCWRARASVTMRFRSHWRLNFRYESSNVSRELTIIPGIKSTPFPFKNFSNLLSNQRQNKGQYYTKKVLWQDDSMTFWKKLYLFFSSRDRFMSSSSTESWSFRLPLMVLAIISTRLTERH